MVVGPDKSESKADFMAMEGHFRSHPDGAPLVLFGWPDMKAGEMRYDVSVPKLSSLILKHSLDAPLDGLDKVDRRDWPPVPVVFWAFRVMVGLGMLMLGLAAWSVLARLRRRLYDWTWLHRFAACMGPAGFVAVIAGWVVTESGRQPWIATGILRTADAISPVSAAQVLTTLILFIVVYGIVFAMGIYYMNRLIEKGPQGHAAKETEKFSANPLAAASDALPDVGDGAQFHAERAFLARFPAAP